MEAVVGNYGPKRTVTKFYGPKRHVGKPSGIKEAFDRQQCLCGKAAPKGCVYCSECQP
jgi:hypothetical protein